jgi:pimeloyl-ACP methyl ester carboxylesterase
MHGLGLGLALWDGQRELAQEFRVIRYDARGAGASWAADGASGAGAADDLLALLDHLGIVAAHLVAHSEAGRLAFEVALCHPERLASIVFVNSVLRGFPWSDEFITAVKTAAATARERGVRAERIPKDEPLLPEVAVRFRQVQRVAVLREVVRDPGAVRRVPVAHGEQGRVGRTSLVQVADPGHHVDQRLRREAGTEVAPTWWIPIRADPDGARALLGENRAWKEVAEMSTMSHEPPRVAHERPRFWSLRLVPEMWASLAITAMWVAVFVTAIWGPDARFNGNDGSSSTIPTAVFVTVFAFFGTWVVAKYGFRQQRKD